MAMLPPPRQLLTTEFQPSWRRPGAPSRRALADRVAHLEAVVTDLHAEVAALRAERYGRRR